MKFFSLVGDKQKEHKLTLALEYHPAEVLRLLERNQFLPHLRSTLPAKNRDIHLRRMLSCQWEIHLYLAIRQKIENDDTY